MKKSYEGVISYASLKGPQKALDNKASLTSPGGLFGAHLPELVP